MTVYRIWPATNGDVLSVDGASYTMGVQFSLSQDAKLTGIFWWSPPGAAILPTITAVWDVVAKAVVAGTQDNAPAWSGAAGAGWVKNTYAGAVTLTAAKAYKASVFIGPTASNAEYGATSGYWTVGAGAAGISSGIITAPNNAGGDGGQDTFHASAGLAYPDTSNGANYWVDVEVTATSGYPAWNHRWWAHPGG